MILSRRAYQDLQDELTKARAELIAQERANQMLEATMNEGRLINSFCSAALRTHVPEHVLQLYAADHKQLPGLYLSVHRLNDKGDVHLLIELNKQTIAYADVIHTLSDKALVVTLTNAIIKPCPPTTSPKTASAS